MVLTQDGGGGWLQLTPAQGLVQVPEKQTGEVEPQAAQGWPWLPHSAFPSAVVATHEVPLQQPAQFVELHCGGGVMQAPWLHCCPVAQVVVCAA